MYLFSLCVLGVFLFYIWRRRVFFSIFHLSHLVEFSALISSLWYGVKRFRKKKLSVSNQKMGGVGVILNYWTQAETWTMDTAPDLPPLRFFVCLLSAPGVSLCSQNNAWVMSALGRRCSVQRFSTNASHNDHVLLPLCTSSTGSTPLEIWAP